MWLSCFVPLSQSSLAVGILSAGTGGLLLPCVEFLMGTLDWRGHAEPDEARAEKSFGCRVGAEAHSDALDDAAAPERSRTAARSDVCADRELAP